MERDVLPTTDKACDKVFNIEALEDILIRDSLTKLDLKMISHFSIIEERQLTYFSASFAKQNLCHQPQHNRYIK